MNNLLSYYGLVDPRISASDKDLPCQKKLTKILHDSCLDKSVKYFNEMREQKGLFENL